MIKTLRITSIIVAIAATGLLVLPAVYGVRSDPKIEEFLKSPGIVEKFTSAKGQQTSKDQSQNSPLVREALKLTTIINPPPPPKPEPSAQPSASSQPAPPVPVAAKFDLVATSYFASHPEQSFGLIDEPGKGQHWVKQGSTIGHLTIETIKDGSIVLRDGQRTSEMTVKIQESWKKLLKNPPPSTRSSSSAEPVTASTAGQTPIGPNTVRPSPLTANRQAGIIPPDSRRNPGQGAMPIASERITSPNQPPPTIGQPGPAEVPQTAPAPEITQPQPEEKPAPADDSGIEATIKKIIESGSPNITNDEIMKLKKLSEEAASPTLNADDAEKKIDELNALISQLEQKMQTSEQSAKSQHGAAAQPSKSK